MKPFNLEEYLKNPSKKVVTRDGRNATIHCTNYQGAFPIVAEIEGIDFSIGFTNEGKYNYVDSSIYDLFFAPEKKEGWISIYKTESGDIIPGNYIDESEELSRQRSVPYSFSVLITTIKIEWEE